MKTFTKKSNISLVLIFAMLFNFVPNFISTAVAAQKSIFTDDFESYAVGTTVASEGTAYSTINNGSGNGNQIVVSAEQKDGTTGNVLQLQGASGWSSQIKYSFTPDDKQYLIVEADVKPLTIKTPAGISLCSNSAGGYWTHTVCGINMENGGFFYTRNDNGYPITTDLTYTTGNWYHLSLALDRTNHIFYIFLDGTLIGGTSFAADSATPEWLELCSRNNGTNTAYFDNINLYSTDTLNIATVTFNSNGGSEVASQTVIVGEKAEEPTAPTKSELIFGGWYKDTGCLNKWNFETDVVTETMTLYAKWNEAHVHTLTLVPPKDASCSATGNNAYYVCSGCDKVFSDAAGNTETTVEAQTIAINPSAHSWDAGEITTPATCTAEGKKTYTCTHNGAHTKTEKIDKIAHTIVHVDEKAATCITAGNNAYYKCSVCDKVFSDAAGNTETTVEAQTIAINPSAHSWDAGEITTPATCTAEGKKTYTCTHNGAHTKTEKIDKIAHTIVHVDEKAATCTTAGNDAYYKCSVCDKYFTDALGVSEIADKTSVIRIATEHTWGKWTVTTPATESSVGEETRTCENDSSHIETREIPKLTHTHTLVKTDEVPATCTTTGTEKYWTCSGCHKVFSDSEGTAEIDAPVIIEKIAHRWNEGEITTPATCDTDGVKTYTCSVGGETKTETIAKTGHTLSIVAEVEATCETVGTKAHYKCDTCLKLFSDALGTVEITTSDLVIAPKGHSWNDWIEKTSATVDTEGTKTRTCKNDSSHIEIETINRLPYAILEGDNQTFVIDSSKDISIRANGTFDKFLGLKMDGKDIEPKFYTAVSDSTIVTLTQEYLDTLDVGEHTLTFVYTDGTVDSTLKIAKVSAPEETNIETTITSSSPKTGDNIIMWICLLVVSALGMMTTIRFIKKKA